MQHPSEPVANRQAHTDSSITLEHITHSQHPLALAASPLLPFQVHPQRDIDNGRLQLPEVPSCLPSKVN